MIETTREDLTAIVDGFVDALLTAAGWEAPPVDAAVLAERHLGMTICFDGGQSQRGRAQRNRAGKIIYLRPDPIPERRQWTIAHEIGEHFKPELWTRIGASPSEETPRLGESLANLFAYRLLIPTGRFAEDAGDANHDLFALKARYTTASHEVIARRMLDLPEPCVITVVDNERVTWRRSNAWPINRRLTPTETACQQQVRRTGKPASLHADGCTVHAWPIHQPDWKREILRSNLEF